MDKDSTNHGPLVQEVPNGVIVREGKGFFSGQGASVHTESRTGTSKVSDMLEEHELKGVLEALLHVSHEPITLDKFMAIFDGQPKVAIHNALRALQHDYDHEGRGLRIVELSGGFVIVTRPDCAAWIARLSKVKGSVSPKVSRSALETLAVIAYRQPLIRSEIEQIRGVETTGVLRNLLDQKLIRIVGRKNVPGRPMLYGTTKIFLQRFGLRDLGDLPPLREFKDLGESAQADLFESLATNQNMEGDNFSSPISASEPTSAFILETVPLEEE